MIIQIIYRCLGLRIVYLAGFRNLSYLWDRKGHIIESFKAEHLTTECNLKRRKYTRTRRMMRWPTSWRGKESALLALILLSLVVYRVYSTSWAYSEARKRQNISEIFSRFCSKTTENLSLLIRSWDCYCQQKIERGAIAECRRKIWQVLSETASTLPKNNTKGWNISKIRTIISLVSELVILRSACTMLSKESAIDHQSSPSRS